MSAAFGFWNHNINLNRPECEPYACDAFDAFLRLKATAYYPMNSDQDTAKTDVVGSRDLTRAGTFNEVASIFGSNDCDGNGALNLDGSGGTRNYLYTANDAVTDEGFNGIGLVTSGLGATVYIGGFRLYSTTSNRRDMTLAANGVTSAGKITITLTDGSSSLPAVVVDVDPLAVHVWYAEFEQTSSTVFNMNVYLDFDPTPVAVWADQTLPGPMAFNNASQHFRFMEVHGTVTFSHGWIHHGSNAFDLALAKIAYDRNFSDYALPSSCPT